MRAPYLDDGDVRLYLGDCLDVLAEIEPESVDAVVCDPPYALPGGFMGKAWDRMDGRVDVGLAYYLSGLIDGEGSFRVGPKERRCEFSMKLRRDDRAILEAFRRFLGHGRISDEPGRDGSRPQARFVIDTKDGCEAMVGFVRRFPLRAKKARDFEPWAEAVGEWLTQPRGNRWTGPADRSRLVTLSERVRQAREYREVPWSGHSFQDWTREWCEQAYRVLKPGGHLLAFGGTRTFHRLTCGIEDAGFEIRDCLSWLYGSGFPKSLDVSKAIDKRRDDREDIARVVRWLEARRRESGVTRREVEDHFGTQNIGQALFTVTPGSTPRVATWDQWEELRRLLGFGPEMDHEVWRLNGRKGEPGEAWKSRPVTGKHDEAAPAQTWKANYGLPHDLTAKERRDIPATDAAREWQGWGTALKPGYEPAVVARKPLTPQAELAAEAARAEEELCAVVSYGATVTSWSELLRESGISSIASSLRACLVDLSTRASTFTTETASSLTTDLAIWRSSLSPITLASITRDPTPEPGISSAANAAAVLSRSVLLKCERLTATTAGETAIARPAVPGLTQASGLDNSAPAWEPCVVARKPLAGTVAENVQAHGTGALNIDATRIGVTWDNGVSLCDSCAEDAAATAKRITPETVASTAQNSVAPMPNARDRTTRADTCRADTGCSRGPNREGHAEGLLVDSSSSTGASGNSTTDLSPTGGSSTTSTESRPTTGLRTCASCGAQTITASTRSSGRWPSNVALDEQAAAMLDAQSGERAGFSGGGTRGAGFRADYVGGDKHGRMLEAVTYGDTGGASRFFYTAKASRADRNTSGANNTHPTVKPTDLMRWLVRLVTPPGGVVLDPFAGSGSTLVAARAEGFRAIGIEREEEYAAIIADRLSQLSLFSEAL